MNAKLKKKTRDALAQMQADMRKDPKLREAAKNNPVRVLRDRGLNLEEMVAAYDAREQWCPAGSPTLA